MDILKGIFPTAQWLEDLDPESALAKQTHTLEGLYTSLVGITSMHPSPCLARLGRHLWDVIHHRHSAVLMHSGVHRLSIGIVEHKTTKVQQCIVLVPPAWREMFEAEPLMQLGAVIFIGSQVVDHFNGRFACESAERIGCRSSSYEAELLKAEERRRPASDRSWLNEYHRHVLQTHPTGFDAEYAYAYRDVVENRS